MIGLGLRSPHSKQVLTEKPSVDWWEVNSENCFNPSSVARQHLRAIARDYPISCHGTGLSLGSADQLDTCHLTRLRQLIDEIEPIAVSDHLSWSSIDGQFFNDLLPLPYTEEALDHFCQKVDQAQELLGRQLLVENPSSYLQFNFSTIPEWEFLNQVQQRTGCGLLLDLNNIHVSAFNQGFDSLQYLDAINTDAVQEIHLAGFNRKQLDGGEIWIDTHSQPVSDSVWEIYRHWLNTCKHVPTLIEWDTDLPELSVLLAEAGKATRILHQESRCPTAPLTP